MNLKSSALYIILFCLVTFTFSCAPEAKQKLDLDDNSLIPIPSNIVATGSSFDLNNETTIYSDGKSKTGTQLAQIIKEAAGFQVALKPMSKESKANGIHLNFSDDESLGQEGYKIQIDEGHLTILAKTDHGHFNGIQTLRQLIESGKFDNLVATTSVAIGTGSITDNPEYSYRGAMLDVARHFFSVKDVKRYIDLIAQYKLNHLHLHLTDDQGWRIEIKSWPNLTTHGGSTEVGGGKGGFYTQEEYKDIVAYAKEQFITIVPEIDVPGHTNAALASYPELNCNGKAPDLYTGIEVGFSTLCTDKEIVYTFMDDVIRELSEMTPGPYIHIGGDESHVTKLEDYIPFIERTAQLVKNHGKEVIGWDEVAHAKLPENSVVQYWAVAKNAKMGVDKNSKVLMSPATKTYLDMQYDSTSHLGLHWAAYIEIDSAYNWEPSEMVNGITKANILGVESPLWSETIETMDDIEYLTFPRLICHSEIGWAPKSQRKWEDFKVRLGKHSTRLENQKVDFYRSKLIPWISGQL